MKWFTSKEQVKRPSLPCSSSRLKLTPIWTPLKRSRHVWRVLVNCQGNEMGTRELPGWAHWCTETRSHHPLLALNRISVYKTPVWWGGIKQSQLPSNWSTWTVSKFSCTALPLVCSKHRAVTHTAGGLECLGKARAASPSPQGWHLLFSLSAIRAAEKTQPTEGAITKKEQCRRYNTMHLHTSPQSRKSIPEALYSIMWNGGFQQQICSLPFNEITANGANGTWSYQLRMDLWSPSRTC